MSVWTSVWITGFSGLSSKKIATSMLNPELFLGVDNGILRAIPDLSGGSHEEISLENFLKNQENIIK